MVLIRQGQLQWNWAAQGGSLGTLIWLVKWGNSDINITKKDKHRGKKKGVVIYKLYLHFNNVHEQMGLEKQQTSTLPIFPVGCAAANLSWTSYCCALTSVSYLYLRMTQKNRLSEGNFNTFFFLINVSLFSQSWQDEVQIIFSASWLFDQV